MVIILHSYGIVSDAGKGTIEASPFLERKVEKLMDFVRLKTEKAFCEFVNALEETYQNYLRDAIVK